MGTYFSKKPVQEPHPSKAMIDKLNHLKSPRPPTPQKTLTIDIPVNKNRQNEISPLTAEQIDEFNKLQLYTPDPVEVRPRKNKRRSKKRKRR